jgi:cellulose synthase operon protein YhjQ
MPVICFASPKGGVGKTTLAANVAGQLATSGKRVIALDLDPQNAMRLHFGVALQDVHGFVTTLGRQPDWRNDLRPTSSGVSILSHGGVDLKAANQLAADMAKSPALLAAPVHQIAAEPDTWLVVDTAPGPTSSLAAILPFVSLLVVVLLVDPASTSLLPAIETGAAFRTENPVPWGVVLNQFDPRTRLGPTIANGVARHLQKRLLGIIYRDESVVEAAAAQKLAGDYAPSAKAVHDIAALTNEIVARLAPPPAPPPAAPARRKWLKALSA